MSEGEAALSGTSFMKPHTSDEIALEFAEAGPYALALLAKICRYVVQGSCYLLVVKVLASHLTVCLLKQGQIRELKIYVMQC